MNNLTEDGFIGLEDAAKFLDIKPDTLRKWINHKKNVPAYRIGKKWKFKLSELNDWVCSGKSAINEEGIH